MSEAKIIYAGKHVVVTDTEETPTMRRVLTVYTKMKDPVGNDYFCYQSSAGVGHSKANDIIERGEPAVILAFLEELKSKP